MSGSGLKSLLVVEHWPVVLKALGFSRVGWQRLRSWLLVVSPLHTTVLVLVAMCRRYCEGVTRWDACWDHA